jgi:hypothetical protein
MCRGNGDAGTAPAEQNDPRMVQEFTEYRRPWKLASLALGIALLIAGSFYVPAPDWDIPISLIMALLAYLTAPWSLRVVVERRWRLWPAMLFVTWFTVDGCYWLYWSFKNPVALEMMRDANFMASLVLYWMCGLVWYYRGSLREMYTEATARVRA